MAILSRSASGNKRPTAGSRLAGALLATSFLAGAFAWALLLTIFHGEGPFARPQDDLDVVVAVPGVAATLATGVFALSYAVTGERRLIWPHLVLFATSAIMLFALQLVLGE